jgi:hypothetical protein
LDIDELLYETTSRVPGVLSAFALIQRWDEEVQEIRNQRTAIEHAANLPIPGKELRDRVARIAVRSGSEPPSVNQVRRRLGTWYRQEIKQRIGVIRPPISNLGIVLSLVTAAGRAASPQLDRELERIVVECLQEKRESEDAEIELKS